ncbi:MAG: sulfite exporter TauE/SafE family protein [Puniceicoccales bacterium]|jgi:uncharacterized membrane protein YfcA|nr:sulfite exporter TauE/SafE family protein [Puniceicoccales bacterium]
MNFDTWQWAALFAGAFLAGFSKTGVAGIGILFVALFANVFSSAKEATGVVLPLLIAGDLVAVFFYRAHARGRHFWRLFPWSALGVVVGFFTMGSIDDAQARVLIGGIVLGFSLLHVWRRWRLSRIRAAAGRSPHEEEPPPAWFAPFIGTLAGFTTLVANAAGPLVTIFFLAVRLPKMEFVGTGAVLFLVLNWFKLPFMTHLGLVTATSLRLNLVLIPAVIAGALTGRWLLARVNQTLFEVLALAFGALAGIKLLVG